MTRTKRKPRRKSIKVELDMKDLFEIVEQSGKGPLTSKQQEKLTLALRTLAKLAGLDESSRNSEKSKDILSDGDSGTEDPSDDESPDDDEPPDKPPDAAGSGKKRKKPGHGYARVFESTLICVSSGNPIFDLAAWGEFTNPRFQGR